MQETGADRISLLFEMIEFAEHSLRQQLISAYPDSSEGEIEAHIASWYAPELPQDLLTWQTVKPGFPGTDER